MLTQDLNLIGSRYQGSKFKGYKRSATLAILINIQLILANICLDTR